MRLNRLTRLLRGTFRPPWAVGPAYNPHDPAWRRNFFMSAPSDVLRDTIATIEEILKERGGS